MMDLIGLDSRQRIEACRLGDFLLDFKPVCETFESNKPVPIEIREALRSDSPHEVRGHLGL